MSQVKVAHEAVHEEKERCTSEGVDCLFAKKIETPSKPFSVKKAIDFLRHEQLALVTADKEDGVVVVPHSVYEEKASEALDKNFVPFSRPRTHVKKEASNLCKQLKLLPLQKRIEADKLDCLKIFFSVKPHKEFLPLKAIASEKGSWK